MSLYFHYIHNHITLNSGIFYLFCILFLSFLIFTRHFALNQFGTIQRILVHEKIF
ncbi:hypothetical protein DW243_12050 [Mediterraneibacter gnavus]|uniref:Uncharacterized protein n=1 Tax=Mediterraneibacter gnavus TaxID=33038 RepID=A0A414UTU2_MEDGN|nr:hypothetical protein DW270_15315 [Mediterraneibacter gnavus]RHG70306.1 hypothetical protein DW248_11420 [Mediterraneibacter gnavus]RHG82471.1 hypothetical protein DW243_12050 [Mediterraneibacter gnavus]HBJ44441.1 hypothetical protein [Ruminococcus sp.]